jgi:hypothetical protein
MKRGLVKTWLLSSVSLLLLLTLPGVTTAHSEDGCGVKSANGYNFQLAFATTPLETGRNDLTVIMRDAKGEPISGAEIEVAVVQPTQSDLAAHTEEEVAAQPQAETDHHAHVAVPAAGDHTHAPSDQWATQSGTEPQIHQPAEMEHQEADQAAEADVHAHTPAEVAREAETATDVHSHSGGHGEPTTVELEQGAAPGEYQGQVGFSREGQWLIKVNFLVDGQVGETEFVVDVVKRAPNWYVLGGFAGMNMLVIVVAAVMKRSTLKA